MIVVTSGARYIDIDAYACCVAYAELLKLNGNDAIAVSTAPWNESITPSLRSLDALLKTNYQPADGDYFVITDLSNPAEFDPIVEESQVIEIIDHHTGFEDYWHNKIGDNVHVEFIGAAATLVVEQWQALNKAGQMSQVSAQLLAAGILDNTLNFKAGVSTERDKTAYQFLAKHASLDEAWVARYFTECQETMLADLPTALKNDTKFFQFPALPSEVCIGQMVVWDAKPILDTKLAVITDTLSSLRPLWLANIVDISGGRSYFVAENEALQQWTHNLLGVEFKGNQAMADRLWLRKEIIKLGQK